MRDFGAYPSANSAFLLNLGLETLPIRMERYCENALKVAKYFEASDKIESVSYAALPGDKYHELAQKYLPKGTCGVISITIKGGKSGCHPVYGWSETGFQRGACGGYPYLCASSGQCNPSSADG